MIYDVAVIGAGASGIMTALSASKEQASVALIEGNSIIGKKLLSTGNGKCNFTNSYMEKSCFNSESMESVWNIISAFSYQDAISFFEEIGIEPWERSGYYYPYTNSAKDVRDALECEVKRQPGIEVFTDCRVVSFDKDNEGFLLKCRGSDTEKIRAKNLVITCGGYAAPKSGSDGGGFDLLEKEKLTLVNITPALVPVKVNKNLFTKSKGFRAKGSISVICDNKVIAKDTGELQLNSNSISGIPALNVSRHVARAVDEGYDVRAELDFCPIYDEEEFTARLSKRIYEQSWGKTLQQSLSGLLPERLIKLIIRDAKCDPHEDATLLDGKSFRKLAASIKHFKVKVPGVEDYSFAQTTAGGISLDEVTGSLELKSLPGVYLAGEILDCDGICGGYNLQWAWSSGYVAGIAAAKCS